MNCPKCKKVVPITRTLKPTDDAVTCSYCNHVISTESMTWADGEFHFTVFGDVTAEKCKVAPRELMKNQKSKTLDLRKIRAIAVRIINREPNLRCVCGEFDIKDSDIRVEVILEE